MGSLRPSVNEECHRAVLFIAVACGGYHAMRAARRAGAAIPFSRRRAEDEQRAVARDILDRTQFPAVARARRFWGNARITRQHSAPVNVRIAAAHIRLR